MHAADWIDGPTDDGLLWRTLRVAWSKLEALPVADVTGLVDALVALAVEGTHASSGTLVVLKHDGVPDVQGAVLMPGWRVAEVLGRVQDLRGDGFASRPARDATASSVEVVTQRLRAHGIVDRLCGSIEVDTQTRLMVLLDRQVGDASFTRSDVEWMNVFSSGTSRVASAIARGCGYLDTTAPLTQRERQTLRYLLSGHAEKEIAEILGLSPQTVHVYVKSLYRKFAVGTRAGLLELWLNPRAAVPLRRYAMVGKASIAVPSGHRP